MTYETLLVERHGPVGWLIFDRPDAGNALDATMLREVEAAWIELDSDPAVRVIVNTGEGRAFQTGVDVGQLSRDRGALREQSRRTRDSELRLSAWHNQVWKPVIAAVNGIACGAAFFLLGECESIVAADSATFFDPHLSHGMPAVAEPMFMLQRMPLGEIMRISLLGRAERMTARRAHEIGLVQEVVPLDQLMDAARWMATVIAGHPDPTAVEATVKAVWTAQYMSIHQALQVAPQLIQLAQTDQPMAARADGLRQRTIEPRFR